MNRTQRRVSAARDRANDKLRTLVSTGRLAAMARETQTEVDVWQAAHKPRGVTCSEGCSACCSTPVFMEVAEAFALLERFPAEVERALPKLLLQDELLEASIPAQDFADLPDPDRGDAANRRIASTYTDLNLRCPFLTDDDKRCTIYAARPIPCRTHFAIGDPKDCVDGHAKQFLWNTPERLEGPARLMERVARATGETVTVGLLQSMVITAINRKTAERRRRAMERAR